MFTNKHGDSRWDFDTISDCESISGYGYIYIYIHTWASWFGAWVNVQNTWTTNMATLQKDDHFVWWMQWVQMFWPLVTFFFGDAKVDPIFFCDWKVRNIGAWNIHHMGNKSNIIKPTFRIWTSEASENLLGFHSDLTEGMGVLFGTHPTSDPKFAAGEAQTHEISSMFYKMRMGPAIFMASPSPEMAGEEVYVVGSHKRLGAWDPNEALVAAKRAEQKCQWKMGQ